MRFTHAEIIMKEYCDKNILLSFVCMVYLLELPQYADALEVTNMGILVPVGGMPIDGRKIVVAVPVAVKAAEKTLQNIQFNWSYADTECDEAHSVRGAFDFIGEFSAGLDVLIGEVCSQACETIGFIAAGLRKPFISVGCNSDKLSRRDIYSTFSRAVPPYKALVPAFGKLLDEFSWNHVGILAADDPVYQLLSIAIKVHLGERKPEVSAYLTTTERSSNNITSFESSSAREVMRIMKEHARIIILIMSRRDVVHTLLQAKELEMLNGEYAFITCDYDLVLVDQREYSSETAADVLRDVQEGLLAVSFKFPSSVDDNFVKALNTERDDSHFQNDGVFRNLKIENDDLTALKYAVHMHDAVMMWAYAKKKSLDIGRSGITLDGEELTKIIQNTSFKGISGEIRFDESGEQIATQFDFWMIQNSAVVKIFQYDSSTDIINHVVDMDKLTWPGGTNKKPSGEPYCGWNNENCPDTTQWIIIGVCITIIAMFAIGGGLFCLITGIKKHKQNKETIINWKIQWIDIIPIGTTVSSQRLTVLPPKSASHNADSKASDTLTDLNGLLSGMTQLFTLAGVYKKQVVAIKLVERDSVSRNDPEIHDELKQMLDMRHDNVNEFVGVCMDAPHVCVLMLYAHKGSLQDLINNETINISNELRMSLATDIVKGMEYLHDSDIGAHGHLTSSNCVVSLHWVCKVTDYGLKLFKLNEKSDINSYQEALNLMWCSPELLRKDLDDEDRFYGTKQGDVYSFGIIVSELVTVNAPYQQELINLTPSDIVYKVRRRSQPPFRPALTKLNNLEMNKWIHLAETCWHEEPHKRPTFSGLKDVLRIMNDGKRVNIMDWLYKTLEESLELKTNQLTEEKARTQRWMYSTFPKSMADALLVGGEVGPQMSDPVTVCFCGLVGMEKLVATLTPSQIAEAISGLHRMFDSVLSLYSVHKVGNDTSSEAMMFVSGLPERSLTHAVDMCTLALHLISALYSSNVSYIQLQIGISTGAVIGVVIGKLIPQFRVYGKTIHHCLAIQAASQARKIRISEATNTHLVDIDNHQFVTQSAGHIKTKDDEKLESFWLRDKIGLNMPLPEWNH